MEKSKVSCSKLKLLLEKEIDEIDSKEEAHKAMGEIGEFAKEKEIPEEKAFRNLYGGMVTGLFGLGPGALYGALSGSGVILLASWAVGIGGPIAFTVKTKYDTETREMLEVDTETYGETEEEVVENYRERFQD